MLGGAGVFGVTTVGGESADVAYSDAEGVVALAMGTYFLGGATDVDASVAIDDVMVAYFSVSLGSMPAVDVGYCVVSAFGGGRAMDDDLGDFSHD